MSRASIHTYYKTALDLHQSGKLSEARKLYSEILKLRPDHFESLLMTGQSWYQEQQFEKAISYFEQGLVFHQSNWNFLFQKGKALIKLQRFDEAKLLFEKLLRDNERNPQVLFHAARNLKEMGLFESAAQLYERLIQLNPKHKQALNNLGNLYQQVYDYEKSMQCYDQLIALDVNSPLAYINKAGLLQKTGNLDQAERLYHTVLKIDEGNSLAIYNLGVISNRRFEYKQAIFWFQKAIQLDAGNEKYLSTYASTLYSTGDRQKAKDLLLNLIRSGARREEPFIKLARIYLTEHKPASVIELLASYVNHNTFCYEGYCLLGIAYDLMQKFEKAEDCLLKVNQHPEFELRANMVLQFLYSKTGRIDKYMELFDRVKSLLLEYVQNERQDSEMPIYNLHYYPYETQLICEVTKKYSRHIIEGIKPLRKQLHFAYRPKQTKIKIGYLSPYFKNHPAGQLVQGVLKNHDHEKFEIYAYAIDGGRDVINDSIRSSVDQYTELGSLTVAEAATKINHDGVHILVSLAGYNYGMKTEIPALKPAPVQVICMDCHDSMQTDFYDYVFKDDVVVTKENRAFFSESMAILPPSHFFNAELTPADQKVNRTDYGLPEKGFVFGCLNHPRKLSPWAMEAWAKILNQVPDSVLWLYDGGIDDYKTNVHDWFKLKKIDTSRIIFCGREEQKIHYRRMELIDLFLDTPIYNGHTTCLEALWMSVPVLTLQGKSISSRLCSSFLVALGIHEMICENADEYVRKAVQIAKDPHSLQTLKNEFANARKNSSFFDLSNITKKMEMAYIKMWENYEQGKVPSDFKIA